MEKVLTLWCNRHTSMAMMRWQAYVHELVRSRQVLAKVIGRWTMQTLAKSWAEWRYHIRLMNVSRMFVRRWAKSEFSLAFDRFYTAVF